jgi:putative heme degradation protein
MIDSIVREQKKIWVVVVKSENQIHLKSDDIDEEWRKMCCFFGRDDK